MIDLDAIDERTVMTKNPVFGLEGVNMLRSDYEAMRAEILAARDVVDVARDMLHLLNKIDALGEGEFTAICEVLATYDTLGKEGK